MLKLFIRKNTTVAGNRELFSKLKNVLNGFDAPIRYAVVIKIVTKRHTVLVHIAKRAMKIKR